eukprot:scaffold4.g4587.t1
MEAKAQALQAELQKEVDVYRELQSDVQKNMRDRQQALQQQGENEMVLEELKLLDDDAAVYKLIGPVLVKQDSVEAKSNVGKRLDFIGAELKRLDTTLAGLEERQAKKQAAIMRVQQELQALRSSAAAPS